MFHENFEFQLAHIGRQDGGMCNKMLIFTQIDNKTFFVLIILNFCYLQITVNHTINEHILKAK